MVSIIITAYKEPKTLSKQLKNIVPELPSSEILVCAPDPQTQRVVLKYHKNNPCVKLIRDRGVGKPAALNLAFQKAKGDIFILTDGDVEIGEEAILEILKPFKNPQIGAVSGKPVSINPRDNMFGYWSHLLCTIAHYTRLKRIKEGKYIDCSGYLYAIRGNLIKNIPENTLAEDALISRLIYNKGYQIAYTPKAKVYVKYPDNFKDWIKQKKRSTGGYVQLPGLLERLRMGDVGAGHGLPAGDPRVAPTKMRGFSKEAQGIFQTFQFAQSPKEFFWTLLLIFARIILWFLIFWEIKIFKKPFAQMWQRVESTK